MTPTPRVAVRRLSSGAIIARAQIADRPFSRLRGLLGRTALATGDGLVIDPCSSVHTCFMRFPIDVLFLDAAGTIVHVAPDVPPFRFASGGRGARRTVELPAGTVARAGIVRGEALTMEPL